MMPPDTKRARLIRAERMLAKVAFELPAGSQAAAELSDITAKLSDFLCSREHVKDVPAVVRKTQ